jgi:hypothetical protein
LAAAIERMQAEVAERTVRHRAADNAAEASSPSASPQVGNEY